jgi:hypothetical protein
MNAILKEEPPEISTSRPDLSPLLDRVVRRCLEKSPGERFQSASDLAFALKDVFGSGATKASPSAAVRRWRLPLLVAASVAAILLGVALYRKGKGPIDSLAVLPFVNASADPETELVVTGRVTQRGDMLSIGAELVDTRGNRQLWGERYDRKFADVLTVQEEIAKQISENLRLRLTGEEQARLGRRATANPAAYQAYLKGFYHARKVTFADLEKGMAYFRQALALDPNYAPAYAGLAYCDIVWLADWYVPAREAFARGKETGGCRGSRSSPDSIRSAPTRGSRTLSAASA